MKGIIRKVDRLGRVVLPKAFREIFNINPEDEVEVILVDRGLFLQKYDKYARCSMTGKASDDIKSYGNGIFLSDEGRKELFEILEKEFYNRSN